MVTPERKRAILASLYELDQWKITIHIQLVQEIQHFRALPARKPRRIRAPVARNRRALHTVQFNHHRGPVY